jgi:hypothetical protein
MKKELSQPKRTGALTLKEFNSLSTEEHNNYILQLFDVPVDQRTGVDNHILKYYTIKPVLVLEEFFIDF